jgi:raffinose/stachyose/melibiose transport system permease protein
MKYIKISNFYPYWFLIPSGLIFLIFFFIPTVSSFYFSLTRWNFFGIKFIGFENYYQFFSEAELYSSVINTLIFACLSCALKVVLGLLLAVLLSSNIYFKGLLRPIVFFPAIVSTIGVAITFKALMDPWDGLINMYLLNIGIVGPKWLTNPDIAIFFNNVG